MDAIIGLIATIFGTILGVYIGYVLSEKSEKRREAREDERQAKSVRVIVGLEIDQNIRFLQDYLLPTKKVEQSLVLEVEAVERSRLTLIRKTIELPLPPFQRIGFESQLPVLANALTKEEVEATILFYYDLNKLAASFLDMRRLLEDQNLASDRATIKSYGHEFRGYRYMPRHPFNETAPTLWADCERIADQIIANNNPIKY